MLPNVSTCFGRVACSHAATMMPRTSHAIPSHGAHVTGCWYGGVGRSVFHSVYPQIAIAPSGSSEVEQRRCSRPRACREK